MSREEDTIPLLGLLPLILRVAFSGVKKEISPYTRTQIYVLTILAEKGSLTMKEVAYNISSPKERATRVVAPLVEDGLVERYFEQENRSKTHVRLTEKGVALQERIQDLVRQSINEQVGVSLSEEERAELSRSVSSVIRLLDKVNRL